MRALQVVDPDLESVHRSQTSRTDQIGCHLHFRQKRPSIENSIQTCLHGYLCPTLFASSSFSAHQDVAKSLHTLDDIRVRGENAKCLLFFMEDEGKANNCKGNTHHNQTHGFYVGAKAICQLWSEIKSKNTQIYLQ